jgi:hypothetical protein
VPSTRLLKRIVALAIVVGVGWKNSALADGVKIRSAATFYASFDKRLDADFAGGSKTPRVRYDTSQRGVYEIRDEIPNTFKIVAANGVHGGALSATAALPNRGRLFFAADDNISFRPQGWGGTFSVWINIDPNRQLKTPFCDPVQITEKRSSDGAVWFDFPDTKPRDLRFGAFPALAAGDTAIRETSPRAPIVTVRDIGFRAGDWHHIAMTWSDFDSGKADAEVDCFIDGKSVGRLSKRRIAMNWRLEKTGIYFAVNHIGLIDELAIFDRPLSAVEIRELHGDAGLLARLKTAQKPK